MTVLLPVYNSEPYLRDAVGSIFAQTFTDFELLVIDDGSTDGSLAILESFEDPRLRIVRHSHNLGLIASLNKGLEEARGDFIARMDADDICEPNRLARQVDFLVANPEIGLCGTWARCFGGYSRVLKHPIDPESIRCFLLFDSAFVHPTVMLRASEVRAHSLRYDNYPHAEDIALWRKAVDLFPTANIPEVLLNYRVHSNSVTGSSHNQATIADSLQQSDFDLLCKLGFVANPGEFELHGRMRAGGDLPLDEVEAWLAKLRDANKKSGYYSAEVFRETLARRWFLACYGAKGWGIAKLRRLRSSAVYDPQVASAAEALKFLVRIRS